MNKEEFKLITPVAFITYIRLDTTIQAFESIRNARPSKLYHISDAANTEEKQKKVEEVRNYVRENIDWPCEFITNYASANIGCKNRIVSGLDWVFSQEEKAIIIEDDVVVSKSFYRFAQEMLDRYSDNDQVMMVTSGNGVTTYDNGNDYWFSHNCSIWGWATWRHAWEKNDVNLTQWPKLKKDKILYKFYDERAARIYERGIDSVYSGELNTWDYGWLLAKAVYNGMEIVPCVNMMKNVGIESEEATHKSGIDAELVVNEISFPLKHPDVVIREKKYDDEYANIWFKTSKMELFIRRIIPAPVLKSIRLFLVRIRIIKA
ncbi:MAG: hypothetical protein MJ133_01405 [Lachnospiraceae bacterium]|nr:hypothetical protein [Lachnospiraceae bacterium]